MEIEFYVNTYDSEGEIVDTSSLKSAEDAYRIYKTMCLCKWKYDRVNIVALLDMEDKGTFRGIIADSNEVIKCAIIKSLIGFDDVITYFQVIAEASDWDFLEKYQKWQFPDFKTASDFYEKKCRDARNETDEYYFPDYFDKCQFNLVISTEDYEPLLVVEMDSIPR